MQNLGFGKKLLSLRDQGSSFWRLFCLFLFYFGLLFVTIADPKWISVESGWLQLSLLFF